jgi:hypothetical protein
VDRGKEAGDDVLYMISPSFGDDVASRDVDDYTKRKGEESYGWCRSSVDPAGGVIHDFVG